MFNRGKGSFTALEQGDFLADRGQLFRECESGLCHVDPPVIDCVQLAADF